MRVGKLLAAGAAAVAVAGMAVPAEAQRWRGGGHYRHHDRIDGGDVLLGALLAGGIIALASSADKKERVRREAEESYRDDAPPPPDAPPPMARRMAGEGDGDISTSDAAADACAQATESKGSEFARIARVGSIDTVEPADGAWLVHGTLETRDDYHSAWQRHGFSCTLGGGAPLVQIEGF